MFLLAYESLPAAGGIGLVKFMVRSRRKVVMA